MKRITLGSLAGLTLLMVATGFVPRAIAATPNPNLVVVKTRIFNDCPFTTLTVVNNYPSLVSIEDAGLACNGFANLHNWSFSEDGTNPASFNNNADYRVSADLVLSGTGTGEGGLRISPWWSPDVDGRFNLRVPDGEIACFGGRLPFYSFTATYGLHYVKGDPIHLEVIYKPNGLSSASPATIIYNLTYLGTPFSSGPLAFDQGNPAEDPPHGLWGELNDARVGGYVQPRMDPGNFGSAFKATFTNIVFTPCQPNPLAAITKTRIFNDCPASTVTVVNNYPSLIGIEDAGLACSGFANLHNWTFADDTTRTTVFNNNSDFRFGADLVLSGSGTGEAGLRLSPWWSQDVDGRFNIRTPDGEIACFGGRLPFYSFTGNFGLHYVKGDPIHLEMIYKPNGLSSTSPATIEYKLTYLGTPYSSGPLAFDQGNTAEDPPHGLWGMLNNGRAGGYVQPRMDPGNFSSTCKATFTNITFHSGLEMAFDFMPSDLHLDSKGQWLTGFLSPPAPFLASQIDVSSIRLNGVVSVSTTFAPQIDGNQLEVKFLRSEVKPTLTAGDHIPVSVIGLVAGGCFMGTDYIKVGAPKIHAPKAGDLLASGSTTNVSWDVPPGPPGPSVSLLLSLDGGQTWTVTADGVPDVGHYAWTVPSVVTGQARLEVMRVYGVDESGLIPEAEIALSEPFAINSQVTGVGDAGAAVFALPGPTRNPSVDGMNVAFSLPNADPAVLSLYDVSGRCVASREVGALGAGRHTLTLAERLPAGLYLVRLTQHGQSLTTRAAVVR